MHERRNEAQSELIKNETKHINFFFHEEHKDTPESMLLRLAAG